MTKKPEFGSTSVVALLANAAVQNPVKEAPVAKHENYTAKPGKAAVVSDELGLMNGM